MKNYPRIRASQDVDGESFLVLREAINIAFYLRCEHVDLSKQVRHSLEVYRRAVGAAALDLYDNQEGEWATLDDKGWSQVETWLSGPYSARVHLRGREGDALAYGFSYLGRHLEDPLSKSWGHVPTSAMEFWLPTEFLDAQGPDRVRALALELGAGLPFNSGEVGFAYRMRAWLSSNTTTLQSAMLRYPGINLSGMDELTDHLGTRLRGPAWLTFLGQPVLGEMGGVSGLRKRLNSPGTTVLEMDGSRALVALGEAPESGDLNTHDMLPHYRELARVLEPWTYEHGRSWGALSPDEIHRWERRFLD